MNHTHTYMHLLIGLLITAALFIACTPTTGPDTAGPAPESDTSAENMPASETPAEVEDPMPDVPTPPLAIVLDGTWELEQLTIDGTVIAQPEDNQTAITIEGDQLSGSAGCNTFGGTVVFKDDTVSVGPLITTLMACEEDIMDFERTILNLLESAVTYTAEPTALELRNMEGTIVARFVPQTEIELEVVPPLISSLDGEWTISEITVDGDTIRVPQGYVANLIIDNESISGTTGCNTFMGSATFEQGRVDLGPLATTRRACPEEIGTFEAVLLTALGSIHNYTGGQSDLTLSDDVGSTVISLTPVR